MPQDARRYLIALLILVVFGGAAEALRLTRVAPAEYRPDFEAVPLQIGAFEGQDLPIEDSIYQFLNASGMIEREYRGAEAPVRLSLLYASDWRNLHSPAGCFPAQGWLTEEDRAIVVPGVVDGPSGQSVSARVMTVSKGNTRLLVLFCFAYSGGTTAEWAELGLRVATGPAGAGGVVMTLNTPLLPDRAHALQRITTIFSAVYPRATAFWYDPPVASGTGSG